MERKVTLWFVKNILIYTYYTFWRIYLCGYIEMFLIMVSKNVSIIFSVVIFVVILFAKKIGKKQRFLTQKACKHA